MQEYINLVSSVYVFTDEGHSIMDSTHHGIYTKKHTKNEITKWLGC